MVPDEVSMGKSVGSILPADDHHASGEGFKGKPESRLIRHEVVSITTYTPDSDSLPFKLPKSLDYLVIFWSPKAWIGDPKME